MARIPTPIKPHRDSVENPLRQVSVNSAQKYLQKITLQEAGTLPPFFPHRLPSYQSQYIIS
jgi:hypothetical protein